jgi:hypothetical protein
MTLHRRGPVAQTRTLSGAKMWGSVPVVTALQADVVVQAALDPLVTEIRHLRTAEFGGAVVPVDLVVVDRCGGRFAMEIVEERPLRAVDAEGLMLLALGELGIDIEQITAEQIAEEPRCTNCRLVWATNGLRVPAGLRVQIQQILSDEGPLRMKEFLHRLRSDSDPASAVLALACADLVELGLFDVPLSPETVVKARSAPVAASRFNTSGKK